jgi:hypothetical protein
MERILTEESLKEHLEAISKIQKEIRQFIPITEGELKNLSDSDYMSKVCHNYIEYKVRSAKEGDFLFQCNYFHNQKYFDRINRQKELPFGFIEDQAEVEINVAGLSKFAINCPRAGNFLCKLRYFKYEQEDYKKEIKNL